MSSILLLLQNVHDIVHDLPMKPNYNEPKIYTGGIDIKKWSKLSNSTKEIALSKEWYVYYSFRNPDTGKFVRQPNSKTGIKPIKDGLIRYEKLKLIQDTILYLLKKGFNPYLDNIKLENSLFKSLNSDTDNSTSEPIEVEPIKNETQIITKDENLIPFEKEQTIREAFEFGLKNKINVLGKASYSNYQGRIKRFLTWLDTYSSSSNGISTLDKKIINDYLNSVLENSGATNRNNTRADLSSLIQLLADNDLMITNFVKSISILKSKPERNKTFTDKEVSDIQDYLKENDPVQLLYIQFITYNFLRPVEVNRLKIGDLDLEGKKLFVRAKNKAVKIKIIPQKILDLLPDLSQMDKNHYLFTPTAIGGEWEAEENNRRNNFSKKFKKIKDHFGMDENYGLYSFRHTAITNLYRELRKTKTPHEAKSILMGITGHQTIEALEKYLRDIDAELPDDYSHLLQ